MQNNISKVSNEQCCGCGACYNKCPVHAITMQEDKEGFFFPVVDESKCTNCGLCTKSCPSLNVQVQNNPKPECYAVMADDEIRAKSSSGGMFTLLAEYVLDKGGYVCGAAFRDDWSVHHIIVDNKDDLAKLRGSKYILSDTEKCYSEVKKLLDKDEYVLFSGCPCQVAGLYSFLAKSYNNLITVELLCHGAPNHLIFRKYVEENFEDKNFKKINFRDKSLGWDSTKLTFYHDNGQKEVRALGVDAYETGFHKGYMNRKSCAPCKYAKLPRCADFTIADFWGVHKINPTLDDGKGTSLLVVNNIKANSLLSDIKSKMKLFVEVSLEDVKSTINVTLYRPLSEHLERARFFKYLGKIPFNKNVDQCATGKWDICYVSIFYGHNYGTILVSYAGHKILEDLGYSVLTLQKPKFVWPSSSISGTISAEFAERHYNISRVYDSYEDLSSLNNICSNFVVGSDQLFNCGLNVSHALCSFVDNQKNKIAFGTSFGNENYNVNERELNKRRYLFRRFNHIALREKSDYLCNELFDIDAIEVIDPTLMLPVDAYNDLSKDVDMEINEPYLLTYTLDLNKDKLDAINYIADKLNLKIINISNLDACQRKFFDSKKDRIYTPEEFLYLYKNASFVVTDSYHGSCFSIKFNKPFVSFINTARGGLRYKLFDTLGLSKCFLSNVNDIYSSNMINEVIDYVPVNRIIEEKSEYAINWLREALENNNSNEKFTDYENYIDIVQKDLQCQTQKANNEVDALKRQVALLYNRKSICRCYYRYKILSKLLFGKKRKHYKEKAKLFHEKVREIRRFGGGAAKSFV